MDHMALLIIAVVLGLFGGSAYVVYLIVRQQRASSGGAIVPPWLKSRGWGLLLVPLAVLAASLNYPFPWLILIAVMLVVLAPKTATRLVPWAWIIFGCAGFYIAKYGGPVNARYGLVPVEPSYHVYWSYGREIGKSPWLVPEAALFLAAGVWLFLRLDAPGSGLFCKLVGRLRGGAGGPWALLLLPVLAVIMELSGLDRWLGMDGWNAGDTLVADFAVLAGAFVLIMLRPELAATAALVGLVFLGAYGLLLAAFYPSVPGGFFGAMLVQGKTTAVIGGGVQGVALLFAAARLAPRIYRTASDQELAAKAERLTERVETLTQTRSDAVDTAATELRRIERDLHDGAQARLVALGMSLQAAERLFTTSPEAALALVSEAKETSSRALTELRDLVRGIYPPVLADRGLGDAVKALALDTPLHTVVDVDLPQEVEMPVGSAVYFAVAEALANAAKHSGARTVRIQIGHATGVVRAQVTDDGVGGADPDAGTGLSGVERRLATFDGILAVNSPPGGPTIVVIEVPCALSSPKTSSC
jgi:signal transduction histidine kinase